MNAEQKSVLQFLLDLAGDYLRGGYRIPRNRFNGDSPRPENSGIPVQEESGTQVLSEKAIADQGVTVKDERQKAVQNGGESFADLSAEINACTACPLAKNRRQALKGAGSEKPLVLVVSECPSPEDNLEGKVLAGETGALLDRMLKAIGLFRDKNCFITYTIKCCPPENKQLKDEGRKACAGFLKREIQCLKPQCILALGKDAALSLALLEGESADRDMGRVPPGLKTPDPGAGIGEIRGDFYACLGIPMLVIHHPGDVLNDTALKAPVWKDLQVLQARLSESGVSRYGGAR
jgi:DNA polymerase